MDWRRWPFFKSHNVSWPYVAFFSLLSSLFSLAFLALTLSSLIDGTAGIIFYTETQDHAILSCLAPANSLPPNAERRGREKLLDFAGFELSPLAYKASAHPLCHGVSSLSNCLSGTFKFFTKHHHSVAALT